MTQSANLFDSSANPHDSVVLTKYTESYEVCQLMVTNGTSFDTVILMKDTGVIQGLPIDGDGDHRKHRKTELTSI